MPRLPAAVRAAALTVVAGLLVSVPTTAADAATATPKAVNGKRVELSMRVAVSRLKVARENRSGYQRERFKHWDDVDRDCQNTRAEVLRAESTARVNSGCTVRTGRWTSAYDGVVLRSASSLDVDHVVPLAEAWDSGARAWSAARREAYANDLTDANTLLAVSASSNRSKGDQDPAQWMPQERGCSYVKRWVTVKMRWTLSVDAREHDFLTRMARTCPSTTIVTHKAALVMVSSGSSTGSSGGSSGGSTGGSSGTDPRYDTCAEATSHGYGPYFQGRDVEYGWYRDADGDGIVCE